MYSMRQRPVQFSPTPELRSTLNEMTSQVDGTADVTESADATDRVRQLRLTCGDPTRSGRRLGRYGLLRGSLREL